MPALKNGLVIGRSLKIIILNNSLSRDSNRDFFDGKIKDFDLSWELAEILAVTAIIFLHRRALFVKTIPIDL